MSDITDELYRRIFDPRMPALMSVLHETLEEVRSNGCDCGTCGKPRAVSETAFDIATGPAEPS